MAKTNINVDNIMVQNDDDKESTIEVALDGYLADSEYSDNESNHEKDMKTDTAPTLPNRPMQLSLLIGPIPTDPPCPQIPMGPPPPIPSPPSPPIQPLFTHFPICPPPFVYFPHPILVYPCYPNIYNINIHPQIPTHDYPTLSLSHPIFTSTERATLCFRN